MMAYRIGDTATNRVNGEIGTIARITDRAVVLNCLARPSGKITYERWFFDYQVNRGTVVIGSSTEPLDTL